MLTPELFFLLQHQQHQELVQQAEYARLVRAGRPTPPGLEHISQHLFWWVGDALLAWGYALKQVGHSPTIVEKECCVCP